MSNNELEKKVMSEITSGRIKLRSKYIFFAEKLGLGSAFVLSVLLAVLFFNLALFYLKASDNLSYLSFGSRGVLAFLGSFPYLLIVSMVVFIFLAGLLLKRSDVSYKKPFGYLALGLVGFIMLSGSVMAFSGIPERIERESYSQRPSGRIFRPFMRHGLGERRRGVAGRVVETGDGYINIQTPRSVVKVVLSALQNQPSEMPATGKFVTAIGEKKGDVFMALNIRVMNERDLPMIRRGVHRRFGEVRFRRP
ncbi:MAG: hypothetical protein UX39_C0021G0004 [Candidatus Magasanikbacteria bacterium GW2011_GWA2_46_17]|uniref:Uncharacterized protein n=1 Tax=Candidatus Magasanikbacteria bacterium GW2011_GWA2_46_17 TaxID=1619042 RepID=A0A0G1NZD6_9BACT|nr:MAG: hypothetical protein UX39_C0021G0004 [Candidatus Magasanikbacteria bacterium GW2011_GWA2_46_17]